MSAKQTTNKMNTMQQEDDGIHMSDQDRHLQDMLSDAQRKRQRVFLRKWQEGRPWLRTVTAQRGGEVISMYCDVCQKHPIKPPGPGKPNETFIKGSTNFRLEAVIRHEASMVHQKAQQMCANEIQNNSADREDSPVRKHNIRRHKTGAKQKVITTSKRQETERVTSGGKGAGVVGVIPPTSDKKAIHPTSAREVIPSTSAGEVIPLMRNAHAVALRGLQLSDYTWLCQLDEAKGLITLHPGHRTKKSAQTFIHHIAQAERHRIQNIVHKSKFVSLIIDKIPAQDGVGDPSPGRAVEELVYLRSVCEGHVTSHFIQRFLTEYPYDEQRFNSSVVKETLEPYIATGGADICSKIVGFGLNQHTVSTGRGPVLNVLKDVLLQRSPWIQGVHCHVTQIEDCAHMILSGTSLYRRVCNLLYDVYELYKNPLNRVALKVVSFAQSNRHKTFKVIAPPDLSKTESSDVVDDAENSAQAGWMIGLLSALENLMESYSDIVHHCQEGIVDSAWDADRMRRVQETLCHRDAVVFIQFVRDVVEELRRLVVMLRDAQTSLFNGYIVTKAAASKLKLCLNSGGKHQSDVTQQLTSSDGTFQGVALRVTDDVTPRGEMRHVVTSLCETLDAGYHDVTMDVLSATVIADLTQWPQSLQDDLEFGDECVKTLLKHFTPVLELAQVKLHRIEVEWNSIKVHLYNSSEAVHQRSWSDIHRAVGKKFSNFLALIDLVLVLPTYSVLREQGHRLRDQMRRDFRHRLDDNLKNDIIMTILHSSSIQDFNPSRAIEMWAHDTGVEVNFEHPAAAGHHKRQIQEAASVDSSEQDEDNDSSYHGNTDDEDSDDDDVTERQVSDDVKEEFVPTRTMKHKRTVHTRRHNTNRRKERGTRQLRHQTLSACDLCDVTFTSSRSLRHHKLIHHKLSPYRCDQCGKCFQGETALIEHRRCHSGEKPHVCSVCGKRFRRRTDLREHVRTHDTNRRRHPCPHCSKSFTQKIHLKYHQMTHTNNYRYYCDQCGKGFQMNCLLVRHKVRAHTHIKPYKCAVCDKSFKTNRDLRIHSDSHDPSKNYICNQCGKMFQSKHLLEGHVMRMHEAEKLPLECATCGKRFRHRTMLSAHERVHTGETPFQCHTCGKTFKQKGHLTAHTRTHTGEKPYRCAVCDASFTVSCSLKKHMKFVHEGVKRCKNRTDRKTIEPQSETQMLHLQSLRIPSDGSNIVQQQFTMDTLTRASVAMEPINPGVVGHYSRLHEMAGHVPGSDHQMSSVSSHPHTRTSFVNTEHEHDPLSHDPALTGTGPRSEMGQQGPQPSDHVIEHGLAHRIPSNTIHLDQVHQASVSGATTLPPPPGTHASQVPTGTFWYMGGEQYEDQNQ